MKNKLKLKKIKLTFLIFMLALTTYFGITTTYSRYISEVNSNDEIKVANAGKLNLVEKLDGEVQANNLDTDSLIESEIVLGENIKKEVYVEFINSEVSNYLFLIINTENWNYNNNLKEFSVINNHSKLLRFYLNDIWSYLEQYSTENKFVFFGEYDVNTVGNNKIDVVTEIVTNIISENDIETLSSTKVDFEILSIQKTDGLSVSDAWNYLNM